MDLREYTLGAVEENLPALWKCVDALAEKGADRIVIGGVPVAAALGRPAVLDLQRQVETRTGVVTSSSFEDHVAALRHLGAGRVAVANRWPAELNRSVNAYLGHAGVDVVGSRFGGRSLAQNKRASPENDHAEAVELGRAALAESSDADALLLPGGNGYFLYAAPLLEEELGVPVLTNATSTLWAALSNRGDEVPQRLDQRWGMLLATL